MSSDVTSPERIAQIRAGDLRAWEDFVARFQGPLLHYAKARLADQTLAEDVVQETFLGFLLALPNFDEQRPVENFLFSIAANKLIDVLRKLGRRPLLGTSSEGGLSTVPSSSRNVPSALHSRYRQQQESDQVATTLRRLVEQWLSRGEFERLQCTELLFVAGWPNQRVARELGLSEQTVANHKQFVLQKLKTAVS